MVAPTTVPGVLQAGIHADRPAADAVTEGALYACSTHGVIERSDGDATWDTWHDPSGGLGQTSAIEFVVDGGGATITTGMKGYIEVPFDCEVTAARLLGDQSGSIVVDVFRCTYSAFDPTTHPASGDKITASAPPTISSAKKSEDTTLTGWTTDLAAGDILGFNVNSVTSLQRATLSLTVTRT